MNNVVYLGALKKGCSERQAAVLAVYVESEKLMSAADELGISEKTARNHLTRAYRRLGVTHAAAAIARVLAA